MATRREGEMARRRDGETARRRDGETARRRDGETARRRDGETGDNVTLCVQVAFLRACGSPDRSMTICARKVVYVSARFNELLATLLSSMLVLLVSISRLALFGTPECTFFV